MQKEKKIRIKFAVYLVYIKKIHIFLNKMHTINERRYSNDKMWTLATTAILLLSITFSLATAERLKQHAVRTDGSIDEDFQVILICLFALH